MVRKSSKQLVIGKNYRFTVLTDFLIRMEYSKSGQFEDRHTQVVQNRIFPEMEYELVEKEDGLEIITEAFHLYYDLNLFSPTGLVIDMKSNYTDYGNCWHYGDQVSTLKGTARTLDKVDGSTELEDGVISRQGFSVLDDSKSFILDSQIDPIVRANEELDLYFFGYQHNYKQAIADYYHLTGSTPVLPRFALGNWWSRFWKYTEDEYLSLMEKFEEDQIPISVAVIDMDWHVRDIPRRFGSGWTGYTWNKQLFPEPERFLEKLHEKGMYVSLNVHPAEGIRACEDSYPTVAARLKLNVSLEEPAVFDFTSALFREAYFEDVHHPLEKQGVDFWWIDWQQGNSSKTFGLDPLWLLNYYHYLDSQDSGAGLILSRFAGPGSHRYPIGFSGDTIISWDSLKYQPYFTATASNIGYSWWSHDIGGHMQGYRDDELLLRWMQFGTYSPINRLHSSASPFNSKEPWKYPQQIAEPMKEALRERYRLIPYLYTMNVRTNEKGAPLIQPMYYDYPEAEEAYEYKNQYKFGSELMVVPITSATDATYKFAETKAWLPEGKWYDFYTGWRYEGNSVLKVYRTLEHQLVFAKAGAIIPIDGFTKAENQEFPQIIRWKVFPGADNSYEMIEEKEDKRCVTKLTVDWTNKQVTLETSGDRSILPKDREHLVDFYCVSSDNEKLDNNRITLAIKQNQTADISFLNEIEKQVLKDEFFRRIDLPNIAYDLKNDLWEAQGKEIDLKLRLNSIASSEDAKLTKLLYELLYIEES